MINLNQNSCSEYDVRWHDKSGVMSNDSRCDGGGGGSVGKNLRIPRNKSNFQPRYGNFLHPDYALLYPSNACYEEPYEGETGETEEDGIDAGACERSSNANPVRGILTNANTDLFNRISSSAARPPYPSSQSPKLCLCEDVLQCRRAADEQPLELNQWRASETRGTAAEKDDRTGSVAKRIVPDTTPYYPSAVPGSDAGGSGEARPVVKRVSTTEKSVMTDETFFSKSEHRVAETRNFRNSCPLIPPPDQLCECEKRIFSSASQIDQPVAGRVLYQNGGYSKSGAESTGEWRFSPSKVAEKESANAIDERSRGSRLGRASPSAMSAAPIPARTSKNKSMEEVSAIADELPSLSPSQRSSSDATLYTRSAVIAECTKCGNRFDVRGGTYYSGAVLENLGSSSTSSSLSETWSSSGDTRNQSTASVGDKDRKLTERERECILKELEEIISGDFFAKMAIARKSDGCSGYVPAALHLDLDALKDTDTSVSESGSADVAVGSPHYRLGRVAELTKHFSKLGAAGIIKPGRKAKSAPNIAEGGDRVTGSLVSRDEQRSVSMEELKAATENCDFEGGMEETKPRAKDCDFEPTTEGELKTEAEVRNSDVGARDAGVEEEPRLACEYVRADTVDCNKRRQSFARQNTVFCKMRSVDELDFKKRDKCRLYKYASLCDVRARDREFVADDDKKKKVVSFDNLDLASEEAELDRSRFPPKEKKKFCLESLLREKPPREQELKINYDKMTTAIRDYLENKELLLKRMKSNSVDHFGAKSRSFSKTSRTCPNFTSLYEADNDGELGAPCRNGMSMDAAFPGRIDGSSMDDFVFKDSIRRVHKGSSYFKSRRFRKCRKLSTRRSVVVFPGEKRIKFQFDGDANGRRTFQSRCQSLDSGIDYSLRGEDILEPSRKL